ncbi:MAG TPA: minor capsid protein [bacterium]|nr:minor capsid protein [bacterium]
MLSALAIKTPLTQAEAIRQATARSVKARNLYTEQVASDLSGILADAEDEVRKVILHYKTLGSLPDNKLAAVQGLKKLEADLQQITSTLRKEQTLRFKKATKASFRQGIYRGIDEFASAQLPFYRDLKPEGIDKLSTKVFTLVDTDALDFMANYNLVLAGDVNRELADGIKRVVFSGVATGKGVEDIVRDLGHVVKDPESFRHAGSKVFSKAQYRMELIARTEVLRAHNQGRIKFHKHVGVKKLEWMTMDDERVCPVCGPLDGKVFLIDRFPQQPAHPNCRCTNIVAWPINICGSELIAVAADEPAACIIPPEGIEGQALAKAREDSKLKAAFEKGEIGDLQALTAKQLQTLAKQNGVSIARTKADFIKLLDQAEPGIEHGDLSGQALQAKIKEYKIGLLRTKEDLVKLLAEKQAALKQAQQITDQLKKVPAPGGLQGLSVNDLKDIAKDKGVSLNMTKQDVIELLDEIEPGVDHSGLQGQDLIAAKEKHSIGPLKNKQQLVKAIEKSAGQDLAEKTKQEALDSAQKEKVKKAKETIEQAASKVIVPKSPAGYNDFLAAAKEAESALAQGAGLPQEMLESNAKELALKKKLFQDQVAAMKSGDLKTLAKDTKLKHWQWANKDEMVTLFTETDPAKVEAAKASIEAKHGAWAEKHGGKKAPTAPSPPVKTRPAPAPSPPEPSPPEPPVFTKKGSEFEDADQAWEKKGKPGNFKPAGKAEVGGAHTKEFWVDESGAKWLFKPIEKSGDEFIAQGEEAAYQIGRLIDPDAVEVRTINLNGKLGSIQKWHTDLQAKGDFSDVDPTQLTTTELEQIQREHVVDWLVSNHDGHSKQFLRARSGKVYGIDKGQLFKHLGEDKLSIDYHPNGKFGEQEPYYNTVFRAVKQGKVKADPSVTLRYIREVEKIADDDYLALLKPYADGRFGKNEAKKKAFLDLALERKRNLRRDFEGFYADVLGKKGFRFEDAAAALPKKGRLGPAEEKLIEEVRKLGWQGKVLPFDEDDIEDQNALIFVETAKGKERTVIKMKVRPEADAKILEALKKAGIDPASAKVGDTLSEDQFADDILAAAKTINHHKDDKKYNQDKLKKAKGHEKALQKLAKSSDPDVQGMANEYLAWLARIEEAESAKKPIKDMFGAYTKKHASPRPEKSKDVGFKVTRSKVLHEKRELKNGDLVVVKEDADNSAMFKGHSLKAGEQFEVEFGDGVRAVYRPWSEKNLYAQRGEFEMVLPDKPDAKSIERAMGHMETLGLKSTAATAEDSELLYLHKQAYLSKAEKESAYKKMIADLDRRSASKEVRVREMRAFWEKRLGAKDLTRMPGYDPIGEYQLAFKQPGQGAGYRHQYRFDLSDEDLEKEMKGYALHHHLTNGESVSSFIEKVVEQNGAAVSTIEKLRAGVPVGGMSPEEDMKTGGASYFFTRIKKVPDKGPDETGLYFKKRLLRRMDAISYDHDAYGKVVDDYVTQHRGSTPEDWKKFARKSGNETIFKYSVTVLDNIEVIVAGSQNERKKILESFRKKGIVKLPDGRKVEDIVIAR